MSDWYLFDAGWLFFAAWSVVVIALSVTAFGGDLFSARDGVKSQRNLRPSQPPAGKP